MKEKIKTLFSSIRFWIVTLTMIIAILEEYSTVVGGGIALTDLFGIVQVWLIAIVSIGTLDSIATKFGVAVRRKK